jgi:uncharacterized protein YbaR (Trm112 family)
MPLAPDLVGMLVCPKCRGALSLREDESAFVCRACRLVFAVEGGIPNFLVDEARPLEEG